MAGFIGLITIYIVGVVFYMLHNAELAILQLDHNDNVLYDSTSKTFKNQWIVNNNMSSSNVNAINSLNANLNSLNSGTANLANTSKTNYANMLYGISNLDIKYANVATTFNSNFMTISSNIQSMSNNISGLYQTKLNATDFYTLSNQVFNPTFSNSINSNLLLQQASINNMKQDITSSQNTMSSMSNLFYTNKLTTNNIVLGNTTMSANNGVITVCYPDQTNKQVCGTVAQNPSV